MPQREALCLRSKRCVAHGQVVDSVAARAAATTRSGQKRRHGAGSGDCMATCATCALRAVEVRPAAAMRRNLDAACPTHSGYIAASLCLLCRPLTVSSSSLPPPLCTVFSSTLCPTVSFFGSVAQRTQPQRLVYAAAKALSPCYLKTAITRCRGRFHGRGGSMSQAITVPTCGGARRRQRLQGA